MVDFFTEGFFIAMPIVAVNSFRDLGLNVLLLILQITGDHGDVTSIAVSPNHHDHSVGNTDIFLGTTKNRILQGTLKTQFKPIMKVFCT